MSSQTVRTPSQKRRTETGASVVEAALILPIFVLLIFSIIEAGSMFLNLSAVRTASREGAREASAAASSSTADQTALIASMRSLGQLSGSLEGVISTATHFQLKVYKQDGFLSTVASEGRRLAVSP